MHEFSVLRRDGTSAPLDISKIRNVVAWSTKNKKVNPLALEGSLTTRLTAGITTKKIQDSLVRCSLELCSPEEPDWRYVAGRLDIWNLWKDIKTERGYSYGNYASLVKQKIEAGKYSASLLGVYSDEDLDQASQWINQEWDADYDYAGAVLLTTRYLLKNELPQEALLTTALALASEEKRSQRLYWAKKIYLAIAQRKISLATPILANLRIPNGSVASCFIVAMDDNLESIFDTVQNVARISKNGGGAGVNVSRIRATGSSVMGKANASGGIIPWIKILNDTAIAVNQG